MVTIVGKGKTGGRVEIGKKREEEFDSYSAKQLQINAGLNPIKTRKRGVTR